MNEIYTERMYLRQFVDNDLDNLFFLLGNPEVGRMLPKGQAYTKEEAKLWPNGFQQYWANDNFGLTRMDNPRSDAVLLKAGLSFVKDTEIFGIQCKYYKVIIYN